MMTIPMNFAQREASFASGRLSAGGWSRFAIITAFSGLLLAGCHQSGTDSAAVDDNDAMLNELLGSLDTTPDTDPQLGASSTQNIDRTDSSAQTSDVTATNTSRSASQEPFSGFSGGRGSLATGQSGSVVQAAGRSSHPSAQDQHSAARRNVKQVGGIQQSPGSPGHRLELRLAPGDQFPLIKTVTQNLVQKSAQWPASAETHLELHMHMRVEDVRSDGILMSVRYARIVYRHDVNGQQLAFDSASGRAPEVSELLPYAGMVNNGFAFWLGRNNRIREVVGYQEFLQRCVQQVPVADQQPLLQELAARFGDNGVASFVDEAIGLLPYHENSAGNASTTVSAGDVWFHERQMTHPVPLTLKSTCRLLAIDGRTAEIDLTGRITQTNNSFSSGVQVRDGRSMGSCVIDQTTGLPLRLNRSTYLNMLVATENGQTVEQEKRVETVIQTQPATGHGSSHAAAGPSQTSMSQTASQPRPVPNNQMQAGSQLSYASTPANPGVPHTGGFGQAQQQQPAAAANGQQFSGQQFSSQQFNGQQFNGQQPGSQQYSGPGFAGQQNAGQQFGIQQVSGQDSGPQAMHQSMATPVQPAAPAGLGLPFGQKRENGPGNGFGGPTPLPGGPAVSELPSTVQAVYPD